MIRWGILGAGNIANRFVKSLQYEQDSQLLAIACRNAEKGEAFSKKYAVRRNYTGYMDLLEDKEIGAIYLALPASLHCEWAIRALQAGKAVLCEKPAAMGEEEMLAVAKVAAEKRILFMEAMKPRFVPIYQKVKRLMADGVIGTLTEIETSWCAKAPDEAVKKISQSQPKPVGSLLECGIYGVSWLEEFIPEIPKLDMMYARVIDGVDYYVDARLKSSRISARVESGFDREKERNVILKGSDGTIVVEELHRSQALTIYRDGQKAKRIECPYEIDDFYGEIHHFVQCLQEGRCESPIMPLEASIRCAQIVDTINHGLVRKSYIEISNFTQ